MDTGFSVSEIAELIARRHFPGDELGPLTRQIRHWTEQGVLEAIGGPFTGSGRHRRYAKDAVYVCAILAELARFGVSIAGLKAASEMLYQSRPWNAMKPGADEVHLRLSYELFGEKRARGMVELVTAKNVAAMTFGKPRSPLCAFSINLTGLVARLSG